MSYGDNAVFFGQSDLMLQQIGAEIAAAIRLRATNYIKNVVASDLHDGKAIAIVTAFSAAQISNIATNHLFQQAVMDLCPLLGEETTAQTLEGRGLFDRIIKLLR